MTKSLIARTRRWTGSVRVTVPQVDRWQCSESYSPHLCLFGQEKWNRSDRCRRCGPRASARHLLPSFRVRRRRLICLLEVVRALIALWDLIKTSKPRVASAALTLVLVVCSSLAYSFGKTDDLILYELAPLMLGLAGGGRRGLRTPGAQRCTTSGYAMFVYATLIAFAMFTAAAAKCRDRLALA